MTEDTKHESPYRILVAVAGDETGDWALFEGARLTTHDPAAELHVVQVIGEGDEPGSDDGMLSLDRRLEQAPHKLEERIERLWPSAGATRIFAHIRTGSPADVILQTAGDIDADIVVVGSHRRKGLERIRLGSIAEKVVKAAHCPVLVALPKNYEGVQKSKHVEPPCPDCLAVRQAKNGESWCSRHRGSYRPPHLYRPSDSGRSSVMPTY